MSKRMTETGKWADRWFRALPPEYKCLWLYLCDNCDQSGVIEPDYELAEFCIGSKVDWRRVGELFGKRLQVIGEHKWWIAKFVKFQNGKLSPECKPHTHVIALLERHGLMARYRELEENGYKGLEEAQTLLPLSDTPPAGNRAFTGLPDPKNGATDPLSTPHHPQDTPPARRTARHFDSFWAAYPKCERKTDKAKCLKFWQAHGLDSQWESISKGLELWRVSESWQKESGEFIPMPYTWLNNARWETPPEKYVKPKQEPKARPTVMTFDDAVNDAISLLWSLRSDEEQFDKARIVLKHKYASLMSDGKEVVSAAMEVIEHRKENWKSAYTGEPL